MYPINHISSLQTYRINSSSIPKIVGTSILFMFLSLQVIKKITCLQIFLSTLLKVKILQTTLFTTFFFLSAPYFKLLVKQQANPLLPFPRLINPNNNCFINVIIQMIFSRPEFATPLLHNEKLRELYNTYQRAMKAGAYIDLASSFRKLNRAFNDSMQHDAFEFFSIIFINPLKENAGFPFFKVSTNFYYRDPKHYESDNCSNDQRGGAQQRIRFCRSGGQRIKVEEITETPLSLLFPQREGSPTIEAFIENNFGIEEMDRETRFTQKMTTFHSSSDYLLIHLKRFYRDPKSEQLHKIHTAISFTPTFSIPRQCDTGNAEVRYRWTSFIVHSGRSIKNGHYIFYGIGPDGKYYRCSDESVQQVSEKDFLNAGKSLYGGIAERIKEEDELIPDPVDTQIHQ